MRHTSFDDWHMQFIEYSPLFLRIASYWGRIWAFSAVHFMHWNRILHHSIELVKVRETQFFWWLTHALHWIFSYSTPKSQLFGSDLGLFCRSLHALESNYTTLDIARETRWDTIVLMIDTCSLLNIVFYHSQQRAIGVGSAPSLPFTSCIGIELYIIG